MEQKDKGKKQILLRISPQAVGGAGLLGRGRFPVHQRADRVSVDRVRKEAEEGEKGAGVRVRSTFFKEVAEPAGKKGQNPTALKGPALSITQEKRTPRQTLGCPLSLRKPAAPWPIALWAHAACGTGFSPLAAPLLLRPWGFAPNPTSLLKKAGPKTFTFAPRLPLQSGRPSWPLTPAGDSPA